MIDRLERQIDKEKRDLQVLEAVLRDHPIGIVRLAKETDLPEHKVRYSLRMLEDGDFVEPTQQGAVPADDVDERIAAVNEGIDDLVGRLSVLQDEG